MPALFGGWCSLANPHFFLPKLKKKLKLKIKKKKNVIASKQIFLEVGKLVLHVVIYIYMAKILFCGYTKCGLYILVIINLVNVIFNLQLIWFLLLTH